MGGAGKDAARVRIPPPFIYLCGILLGYVLQSFVSPLPLGPPSPLRVVLAAAFAIPGAVLIGGAMILFRRTGQSPEPWKTTPEIISTGVYRWTRNPMYVGLALIQASIGFATGNGWLIALVPFVLLAVYAIAVRPEEAYLEQKFGEAYVVYKNSVRRWV